MEMEITFPGGKRVDAISNGFVIETDQPAKAGGDGVAPTPFTLFLASIGTCAGIYVLGFCQQRSIPTEDIRIRQSMTWDPATRRIQRVNLDIDLPPDFPAGQPAARSGAPALGALARRGGRGRPHGRAAEAEPRARRRQPQPGAARGAVRREVPRTASRPSGPRALPRQAPLRRGPGAGARPVRDGAAAAADDPGRAAPAAGGLR